MRSKSPVDATLAGFVDRVNAKTAKTLFGADAPDPKQCAAGLRKRATPLPTRRPFVKIENIKGAPAVIVGVEGEF